MKRDRFQVYLDANPSAKLRDIVSQMLYDEIVSLCIAPGTKLNVNSIATALGISRTPVAEAIMNLCEQGFVVSKPDTSGFFVIDLSLRDMIDLYDVRGAIECEAAALCTERADSGTVHELDRLAGEFADCVIRKDYDGMIRTICEEIPFTEVIVTEVGAYRMVPAEKLGSIFRKYTKQPVTEISSVEEAFDEAYARKGDGILFCVGSLYLVGSLKEILRSRKNA